ncbi:MAG TPA: hypothetical protein VI704_00605 [Bacteroidota bacterium]|nr:hypothetical protein [Bacteroidota bacterium]
MDKKKLLKMAKNPNFISGIYNYCDRWCERCAFTRRCLVFAQEQGYDEESRDINNKKFWDRMHDSFKLTMELLDDFAKENRIDLNDLDVEEEKERHRARDKKSRESPIARAAKKYSTMVKNWFDHNDRLFKEKGIELTKDFDLGIEEPEFAAAEIIDTVEVIRWYQDQIWVKLMRALSGEERDKEFDEDLEMKEFPKDSDGSAKAALVGIDRSIGAWGRLTEQFTNEADEITAILVHLTRLRANIEQRFPGARLFVRPGFDQEA